MAGYKETPRQKMIGMMYLVLTALLALNVSKDILNAFVVVNEGLVKTTSILTKKNDQILADLEKAKAMDEAKVGPYLDKALKAKSYADEVVAYITDLKREIIAYTEFGDKELQEVEYEHVKLVDGKKIKEKRTVKVADFPLEYVGKKDNYDKPMEILIGQSSDGSGGKARELRNRLLKLKADMMELIPEKRRESVNLGFDDLEIDVFVKEIGKSSNWEMRTFYHTVLAADVIILNRLIAEVLNIQAEVIAELTTDIDRKNFKFDVINAKVIPNSSIVLAGSEYLADIIVAAYSTTSTPKVYIKEGVESLSPAEIASATLIEGDSGVVTYRSGTSGSGERKYAGLVEVVKPGTDEKDYYPFNGAYNVSPPSATVSADAMNVVYRGLDNPLSISVPGVPNEKVRVSFSGCTSTSKGGGKYTIKPSTGPEVTVSVSADIGGRTVSMGAPFKFRVKNVPMPIPKIAGANSGTVGKMLIVNSPTVAAVLEDFQFEGVTFRVNSFTVVTSKGLGVSRSAVTGNRLDASAITAIRAAPSSSKMYIDDIRATGPDGRTTILPSISLTLQ